MAATTEKINANPRVFAAKKGSKRETRGLWGDSLIVDDDDADMETIEPIDAEEIYGMCFSSSIIHRQNSVD